MEDFHIHSYPSVHAIGHAAIKEIFDGFVIVQEKVDGSQFSFGKTLEGELVCRSKGKQLLLDAPEKMFVKAVVTVRELEHLLTPGWIYRGEFLSTPKHNTLKYGRVPEKNIILFDIQTGLEEYLVPAAVRIQAERLGLETVPTFYAGNVTDFQQFNAFLETESVLGGCKIEGVVVKNYAKFTADKKVMMGKYVSEAFKEKHSADWKERNPNRSDVIALLIQELTTTARWQKAVQHLREAGKDEICERYFSHMEAEDRATADRAQEYRRQLQAKVTPQELAELDQRIEHLISKWRAFQQPEYIADFWWCLLREHK
jgi:hypothetical protein